MCFQKSGACSFGTLNVHAPPLAFLGSSHRGFTPFLNRCTESLRCMARRSKLLYNSQKCCTSLRSRSLTSRSSYLVSESPSTVVEEGILVEEAVGEVLRSCLSCQNSQLCTKGYVGRRRRCSAATMARPRAGEDSSVGFVDSGSAIEGRVDVARGWREDDIGGCASSLC